MSGRVKMRRAFLIITAAIGIAMIPGVSAFAATAPSMPMHSFGHSHTLKYVALGDSVPAGLGLPLAPDASPEDQACGRSPSAYANEVGSQINAVLSRFWLQLSIKNAACQGAVVDNLSQPQTIGGASMQSQLDTAFANGTPTLMTLTIGANDAHWASFIGACFSAADCDTDANTTAANAFLTTMQTKLSSALADIRSRSPFLPPVVVVTGYYNPVSVQCISSTLTASEVAWLAQETAAFNQALRTATEQAGWFARFAPVDFTGHDICSADSWVQRPNVPGEPAPFHPTARGQQAMAEAVLHTLGF